MLDNEQKNMNAYEQEEDNLLQELDLRRFLLVLIQSWRLMAMVLLISFIVGVTGAMLVRGKTYTATSVLLLRPTQSGVVLGEGEHFQLPQMGLDTLMATVKLPSNLQKVIERLNLDDDVHDLSGKIKVHRSNNSNLLNLTAAGDSPKQAMAIADTTAEVFIEERKNSKGKEIKQAVDELEALVGNAEKKFNAASEEAAKFSKKHGIVMLDIETEQSLQKTADLKAQIEDARVQLSLANRQISSLSSDDDFGGSAGAGASKVNELQNELSNLRSKYTEENPRIMKLKAQIAAIDQSAKKREKGRLRTQSSALYGKLSSLKNQKKELAEKLKNLNANQKDYAAIRQKLILAKQVLRNLMVRMEEAKSLEAGDLADFKILELAVPPKYPEASRAKIYAVAAPAFGLFFVIMLILVKEFFNPRVRSAREVYHKYGLTTIGQHLHDPMAPEGIPHKDVDLYRPIVSTLEVEKRLNGKKLIGLFSTLEGSGLTTVCMNLARVYAKRDKKVLLLDLGINEAVEGSLSIKDIVKGYARVKDMIIPGGEEEPDLMCAGFSSASDLDILVSDKIKQFLDVLRRRYDLVLIDCPPAFKYIQILELAPKLDASVLVTRSGVTYKDHLERTVRLMQQGCDNIMGVFMVDAEPFLSRKHEIAMAEAYRKIVVGRDFVEKTLLRKMMS